MSYAASLLATYPSAYGPTNLLSDDLVQRTAYDNIYPPAVPYLSSGRLLSDDLAFNQINYDSKTYRPSLYPLSNSQSVYPTTKYQKLLTSNQRLYPPNDSLVSLNDITEYSDSLATASNTNTASSMARSIDAPINMFSIQNRLSSNDDDVGAQGKSVWTSPKPKPKPKGQSNQIKGQSTTRTQPSTVSQKKPSGDELDNDITPVPSPKQQNPLQRNATIVEITKPPQAIDIQAWVNDTEKVSPVDEKAAEQAWSVKIGHLHEVQAKREKDKAKSSRALPIPPKKVDTKPVNSKTKPPTDPTHQLTNDSYFDSLFDGDYFRKQTSNNYSLNSSLHQSTSKKPKFAANSFDNSNTNNLSKNPKHVPQRKTPRYEPPTSKRAPAPPPTITTTSWRKQAPKQYLSDSLYPYYTQNEFTHRDVTHKDTDERFREALQKVRADRAEQQQKEINEKTAKRLHYGDYVRRSTKHGLLQNTIKPSPWSDFMDLKKGNLYSLSKEEKKQLYNQSKSYGERIRYRNFAIQHATETSRSHRHSVPLIEELQELESGNATPRQHASKSVSRTSKRPDSASTNRSHTKQTGARGGNRIVPNRGNVRFDRSNNPRPSDDEYENLSDYETNRKPQQKNVRYAKYDSSGQPIEESDNDLDNRNQRNIESDARYKKR